MRTVRLYMTMTCDGFFAGPGNELDWMTQTADPELNRDVVDLIGRADAAFMGYPMSHTRSQLPWDNAELLVVRDDGDLRDAVNAAKRQPGRDIGVPGGIRTAQNFARASA